MCLEQLVHHVQLVGLVPLVDGHHLSTVVNSLTVGLTVGLTLGLLLVWCVGTYCFFSTHRCWRPGKARRDQYLERDVIVT